MGIFETYPIDSRAYYVSPIQKLIYTVEQENKTLTLTKTSYTVLISSPIDPYTEVTVYLTNPCSNQKMNCQAQQ